MSQFIQNTHTRPMYCSLYRDIEGTEERNSLSFDVGDDRVPGRRPRAVSVEYKHDERMYLEYKDRWVFIYMYKHPLHCVF